MPFRRRTVQSRRSASPRRRVLIDHTQHTAALVSAGANSFLQPLANLETRLSQEITNAQVLRIWGQVTVIDSTVAPVVTQAGGVYFGAIISSQEFGDIISPHPDPRWNTTNNDKYADWYGIDVVHVYPTFTAATLPGLTSQAAHTRSFSWARAARGRIRQPEDNLIMVFGAEGMPVNQTVNVFATISVAVAL